MNHTTLGLIAILAAATLVIGTLATVAPAAFAGGHHKRHYKESTGDGNTLTAQENQGKAIASGFGTTAANIQLNTICIVTPAACL
jgi:hypothetical protein